MFVRSHVAFLQTLSLATFVILGFSDSLVDVLQIHFLMQTSVVLALAIGSVNAAFPELFRVDDPLLEIFDSDGEDPVGVGVADFHAEGSGFHFEAVVGWDLFFYFLHVFY